jgi:hypothetical protein
MNLTPKMRAAYVEAVASEPDTFRLWFLNRLEQRGGMLAQATEARERRQALHRRIAECNEGGQIAIIESGMDCDCVRYSGHVSLCDATVAAFDAEHDHRAHHADGPFSLSVERPSVARGIRYESRDLALEAFEDGHPHSIHG